MYRLYRGVGFGVFRKKLIFRKIDGVRFRGGVFGGRRRVGGKRSGTALKFGATKRGTGKFDFCAQTDAARKEAALKIKKI